MAKDEVKVVMSELVRRINEDMRRIRSVEQRTERIDTAFAGLEERMLTQLSDLKISLEKIGNKISAVSDRIAEFEKEMSRMEKEMSRTASKADVKQIETYLDIVNPLTSKFVTKDELERFLEEKMSRKA